MTSDILTQCALCGQQYTEPRVGAASAIYHLYLYLAASAVSPHLLLELSVELHSQVTVTVSIVGTLSNIVQLLPDHLVPSVRPHQHSST